MYNAANERESSINILYDTYDNEIMMIVGWLYEQTKWSKYCFLIG